MMASSDATEVGSAFKRTEPARMKGSCGMVMSLERMISRGSRDRSRESIVMLPESRSRMRRRTERSDDLPLYPLGNT